MVKTNRLQMLQETIKNKKFVLVKDLLEEVECSPATLQRDLKYLEDIGEITRSYGGVSYIGVVNLSLMNKDYLMYNKRKISMFKEKTAIGKKVQEFLKHGDTIYMTHGTTTSQIVQKIDPQIKINIVTDGVDIILGCEKKPNIRVIATGGLVNYNSMQIEHNPYITNVIENININKLIMGAGGITETNGITFYDFASFSFLKEIIQKIDEIIVVADHSKFGKVALANFISFEKISKIITDQNISKEHFEMCRKNNIECIIADVEE